MHQNRSFGFETSSDQTLGLENSINESFGIVLFIKSVRYYERVLSVNIEITSPVMKKLREVTKRVTLDLSDPKLRF